MRPFSGEAIGLSEHELTKPVGNEVAEKPQKDLGAYIAAKELLGREGGDPTFVSESLRYLDDQMQNLEGVFGREPGGQNGWIEAITDRLNPIIFKAWGMIPKGVIDRLQADPPDNPADFAILALLAALPYVTTLATRRVS